MVIIMKMKVNKIRNVEKSVCFAEQKIAYNYAFMYHTRLKNIFNSDNTAIEKSESYQEIIDFVVAGIKSAGLDNKYNIDAIIHCFKNGIENYMNFNNSGVLSNYEDIGKIFTCLCEIE